jgi:hypothetical protein
MEQQSDNNLDALFQKAAEEYPLKTNSKNWGIVAAKLHPSPISLQTKKNKKWQYAALLLLLLGGSFFIVDRLNKKQTTGDVNQQNSLSHKKDNSKQQLENKTAGNQPIVSSDKNDNLTEGKDVTNKHISSGRINTTFGKNEINKAELSNQEISDASEQIQLNGQSKLSADKNKLTQSEFLKEDASSSANKNMQQPEKTIAQNSNKEIKPNPDTKDNIASTNNRKSTHVNMRPQPKTFYGMFFFSPDFSTVKFQHINKPGYSIGVALGYRINNRLSAELGLQRMHANFYSDGKYFDRSNIKLSPSAKLDALNGTHKLTAIPVALRYNLFKNNYHFFATAGTTVALMTHTEKYDYNIIKNGRQKDVYRKFNALTGTKFFSSVNVSFGYQAPVSKFFDVKVEPYFQAATKGLGIGNLPVNNFGINVGIIKDLK